MKLALVISSLGAGGAERVLVNMANYWARRGEEVCLITMSASDEPTIHILDDRVKRLGLGVLHASHGPLEAIVGNFKRIRALRKALRTVRPTAVVSFIDATNVTALFASKGLGFPVIVSDRVDPTNPRIGRVWEKLREISYPSAAAVVIQTNRFAQHYSSKIQKRLRVIQNPISGLLLSALSGPDVPRKETVLAVGRLSEQKSFGVLIDAFDRVASKYPSWKLEIYGEGPLRDELQEKINMLAASDRMHLMGITDKAIDKMRAASVFALSSQSEGIPNVLLEAMAAGCPSISTDVGAVSDILVQGENGLIVPAGSVDEFAHALDSLMGSAELRKTVAARSVEVLDRFSEERIMALWDQAVRDSLAKVHA